MPFLLLFLGLFMLVSGVSQLQGNGKRVWGYASIAASLFIFYASIQGFMLK
ncbi:DUF3953 domain-containing protein [Paenibacillus sp. P26]|nr:DUF3953 domain-containing protein [Paenibacillus sp. P26]UUZ97477.1 DUF3953 domain-containing protein [Paenibacillus sp. P25]